MQQSHEQAAMGAGAIPGSGPNIGHLVLRRKWMLLFFLGLGVGLGYLYFTQQPPVYQSAVQLLVTQNRPALPTAEGRADAAGPSNAADLATQCMVATSPAVLMNAVKDADLRSRPEFGTPETALALISRRLVAAPAELNKAKTSVMQISYQGSSPGETLAVVNAVLNAYRKFLGQSDQAVSDETLTLVTEARGELLGELERLEREYAAFRADSPLLGQGENKVNPHAVRLTELEAQRTSLLLRRSQLQAKIDAVREALARGGSREALALMVNQLRENEQGSVKSEATTVAEKLFPLLLEKELLTENLGVDHPKVQSIEKQIQLTRSHLNDILSRDGGAGASSRDLLDIYLDSLGYEIEATDLEEKKLQQLFETETEQARQVEAVLSRDRQLSGEIERKNRLLDAIVKRLDEMSLFATRGIRTQTIAEPGLGVQIPAKRTQFMALGGLVGLFLAGGLAYLLELSDRSFRTPEDIRDEIGAPVIGHIPVITSRVADVPDAPAPAICTVHTPKTQSSEAFRLVRTALFFGARSGNLKVIQVTSPDQGDGKSTVSANLAVAIAQSGRRTLLIDADMRRPTVHRLFKVNNETGLSTVIGEGIDPLDAIVDTVVANLTVLPCGKRPENPAELLSRSEFDDLLAWARDRYDFVILDTPPLLAVSDPGNVAVRTDGVLLALRLNKKARAKAAEAREILERFGANVIGVVINGVNAKGEYGYRSAYRYTYSSNYRYRYGYGYSYSYSKPNSYTEEPGDSRASRAARGRNGRDTSRMLDAT